MARKNSKPQRNKPYGSAGDLPSFKEIAEQLQGLKIWANLILSPKQRKEMKALEAHRNSMVSVVDSFYELLGERNWLFHDKLRLDKIEQIIKEETDVETAEKRIVEIYRDERTMESWILGLREHDGLRSRMGHIERAHEHYKADRFDSCVLHLLSVMDGFVNDCPDNQHKGLHAREREDMVAWDSVTAHHLGLHHAMKSFKKSFKKRVDEEVFDLHRNGIVHGMIVNFDNVVVATKAWGWLFSVSDWSSSNARAEQLRDKKKPSWGDISSLLLRRSSYEKYKREFQSKTLSSSDSGFKEERVFVRTSEFLTAWEKGRWALVANLIPPLISKERSRSWAIQHAKNTLMDHEICRWRIDSISYIQPSAADIKGTAFWKGEERAFELRMALYDPNGNAATPEQENMDWYVCIWAPEQYFSDPT